MCDTLRLNLNNVSFIFGGKLGSKMIKKETLLKKELQLFNKKSLEHSTQDTLPLCSQRHMKHTQLKVISVTSSFPCILGRDDPPLE